MKVKLVDDWKKTWRYYSQQTLAAVAAIQLGITQFPQEWTSAVVPFLSITWHTMADWCTGFIACIGIAGRLIDQQPAGNGEPEEQK